MSGIRRFALVAAAGLWVAAPGVVLAQAVTEDQLIAALEQQGFTVIESGTTFLGRLRITAEGPEGTREVVLNPRNGKVLRDIILDDGRAPPPVIVPPVILPPVILPPVEAATPASEPAREVAGPQVQAVPEAEGTEAGRSAATPAANVGGAPLSLPGTATEGTAERSGD
jgi:hypothetical protein